MPATVTEKPRKHKYRHLAAMLYGVPLAIVPEKLEAIIEVFELRRSGQTLSDEEIRVRIGAWMDDAPDEPDEDDEKLYAMAAGGVAVIPIQGVISRRLDAMDRISGGVSSEAIAAALTEALDDPEVKSIVLDVDSPGGEVTGTAEAADRVFAARGKKPIVAVSNGQMSSAAYWIGSAADSIAITPSSSAGSIGVIGVHRENSTANAKNGVTYTVISAGKHKADGNQYEPLSKQGRETLDERINDAYAQFTAAVARNRGTTVDAVRSGYGQGKSLDGQKAVEARLADRVATLDQIVLELGARGQGPGARNSGDIAGFPFASSDPSPRPPVSSPSVKEPSMSARLKAALFARGLISAVDASDELATVATNAFFAARGQKPPAEDDAAINALMTAAAPPAAPTNPVPAAAPAAPATAEVDRARAEAVRLERERIDAIRTRGAVLNVEASAIQASIDAGDSLGEALTKFTAVKGKKEPPVTPIEPNGSEVDNFARAAIDALSFRCASEFREKDERGRLKPLSAGARELRFATLLDVAKIDLRNAGIDTRGMDNEDIGSAWLQRGCEKEQVFRLGAWDGTSYQTPSDYPNILSAIAGKMMDLALQTNTSTFRDWAYELPAVADFKPKTIAAVGGFPELPLIVDGDDVVQSKRFEEASFIQADSYGDKCGLTPVMIANDDLGFFNEILADKVIAHELTLNRLCVSLLTGNVVCADGNALFGGAHANVVSGGAGAAPSVTQAAAMRALFRAQTDVGGLRKMRVPPAIALFPSSYETAAEQVFQLPPDGIYYAADTSINTFRRSIKPILEQQLDDASPFPWYLLGEPRRVRSIVFCFQIGFEGGKVLMYYDPSKRTRIYQIEGRFASAVRNWRGIARNSGGNGAF